MIWYGHEDKNAPALRWNMPYVSEEHKAELTLEHPPAIPAHCKPWIDGQSAGLVVVWPFDDIIVAFRNKRLVADPSLEGFVHEFADDHWSINPRYFFKTQENVGLLTVPHSLSTLKDLTVRGLIETDWYVPAPFFVFTYPHTHRDSIIIRRGDPLLEVVPVIIDKGLAPMDSVQLDIMMQASTDYFTERFARKDLLWTSNEGQGFSRLYKILSRKFRNERL